MTIEIPLTQGQVTIIDDIDKDLAEFKWRVSNGYVVRKLLVSNQGSSH